MRYVLSLVVLASFSMILPATANSQEPVRPAAHWGSFTKNASLNNCLRFASDALRSKGYKLDESHGHIRIGETPKVIVQVVCIPAAGNKTTVIVSAYSSDSATAEQARNTIREYITKVVIID